MKPAGLAALRKTNPPHGKIFYYGSEAWYTVDMKKIIASMLAIVAIIFVIIVMAKSGVFNTETPLIPSDSMGTVSPKLSSPVIGFAWRYENGVMGADGLPQTRIFLDTTYENGKMVALQIDQVQGSCNPVDPAQDDTDMTSNSVKIQCYAAGFGQWYKIVPTDRAYEIRRKYFEEANPEYLPTNYQYETVAEIPLFQ